MKGNDMTATETRSPYASCNFFDAIQQPHNGKTRVLSLVNKSSGDCIGVIKWYGPWRQYCFYPSPMSVWSDGCLVVVQEILTKLRYERRK